ncbi:MAG: prepilin peptidase [bacterium]|nr:prepilin peptidase [bacterium]
MVAFVVFVFGLAIGSFLNAVIYRMEKGESVLRGRSYCPHCKHPLAWHDLVPLLSFFLLRGKCRYCKEKISFQYPLVELATALLFIAIVSVSSPWLNQGVENLAKLSFTQVAELFYLWVVASAFIVIFVYDLKHYLIPDKILYPIIGLVLLYQMFGNWELGIGNFASLINPLASALGAGLFFFFIYAFSKGRAMGFGDVKLAFLLGLFLGWPSILVALFFAFCLGAVFGLILIALKKKGLKSEVPFAPFLITGTAIAFFFGLGVLNWYLGLFLV